jgi:hypothetical protein
LVSAGILAKVVSHPQTVNLGKEDDDGSEKEEGADDLEQGVIPEQQSPESSDNLSPTNPVFSEEVRSSLVSAGILAKVVSHPQTVNLGKEDDDGGDLGIIPDIQALADPALIPKQSEEMKMKTPSVAGESLANVVTHLQTVTPKLLANVVSHLQKEKH